MPKAALPGGEVIIEYSGLELAGTSQPEVRFGDFNAQVTMASNDHIIAKVPESSAETGTSELTVSTNGRPSRPFPYEVGKKLASNLHPVANPASDTELFTEGMGIATGMAFDRDGNLYVGDRSGSIFKISASKEIFVFATLEPSMAAYHLAFGFDDYLYVTGPTTSSFDSIYRISPSGEVDRFFTGLGRPQGLAFDIEGSLYAVASYRGRRGIFRLRDPKNPELFVAGLSLVGLAFDMHENLMVVDSGSLYRVRLGIMGKPLP